MHASAAALLAAAAALLPAAATARSVTLSNTALPRDTAGNPLITGEATILAANATYYVYLNDWGGCPGVDCCPTGACASCCFNPPSKAYPDACVYTNNHSVVAYETPDFETWTYLGVALPLSARLPGIEFRPQVVWSPPLQQYVMWYEDRWSGQRGYAVATSPTPGGPFTTVAASVIMAGAGRIGDYDVFVDDDGTGYHVRTGLTIEKLAPNMTMTTGEAVDIPNGGVEGPAMFKRGGVYYILVGEGCCACIGGSNVVVYTAPAPLGPYTRQGDVGSNTTHAFDPASPFNYVTRAQGSKVVVVPAADGSAQYLWLGNQWVTARTPSGGLGGPRNADLLYWTLLDFNASGALQQMVYAEATTISVP
jgi:hypothetical protein